MENLDPSVKKSISGFVSEIAEERLRSDAIFWETSPMKALSSIIESGEKLLPSD